MSPPLLRRSAFTRRDRHQGTAPFDGALQIQGDWGEKHAAAVTRTGSNREIPRVLGIPFLHDEPDLGQIIPAGPG